MAVIRKNDIKKLGKEAAEKKVSELEFTLLELEGEGKGERRKPVKKAIAKLKTHIRLLELAAAKEKSGVKNKAKVKK